MVSVLEGILVSMNYREMDDKVLWITFQGQSAKTFWRY